MMVARPVQADVREDEDEEAQDAQVAASSEVVRSQARAYRIASVRGRGGFGTTYVATSTDTGERVLLKELSLARAESWKSVELFEREAAVLARIGHVGIPRFIESFVVDADGAPRMFLAQELIDGPTLAERVRDRGPLTPSEATTMLVALADVLALLHAQDPPIVHRDVTPSNIVLGADGRVRLVDFGAVQDRAPKAGGGSTMVGTAGYVPMEQLMGQARPASDLYALGMSVLFALTGKDPATLPVDEAGGGVRVAELLDAIPEALRRTLERMIAPTLAARLGSARAVRTSLSATPRPTAVTPFVWVSVLVAAAAAATLFLARAPRVAAPMVASPAELPIPEAPRRAPLPTSEPPFRQTAPMPRQQEEVARVLAEATPQMNRECWDVHPEYGHNATVVLNFTIDRHGAVSRLAPSGTEDALTACVAGRVGKLRFPASDDASTFELPLSFNRSAPAPDRLPPRTERTR